MSWGLQHTEKRYPNDYRPIAAPTLQLLGALLEGVHKKQLSLSRESTTCGCAALSTLRIHWLRELGLHLDE
jgi:hypothetical protein